MSVVRDIQQAANAQILPGLNDDYLIKQGRQFQAHQDANRRPTPVGDICLAVVPLTLFLLLRPLPTPEGFWAAVGAIGERAAPPTPDAFAKLGAVPVIEAGHSFPNRNAGQAVHTARGAFPSQALPALLPEKGRLPAVLF